MDLSTLFAGYAGVLFACGGSLTITWRQNPEVPGPKNWALASLLGAGALLIFALAALDPTQVWINVFANAVAGVSVVFYARGSRQFVGLKPTPRWFLALCALALGATITLTSITDYGPGVRIIFGSLIFGVGSYDVAFTMLRRRRLRSLPTYFVAVVFFVFAITHTIRGGMTCFDYTLEVYQRPVDMAMLFVGIIGWGAVATGYAMLTTQRLLDERAEHLHHLESRVGDLREKFLSVAKGNYKDRARDEGTKDPMDVLGRLFNETASKVGSAFEEIDRQRSVLVATQLSMLDGLLLIDNEGCVQSANPALAALLEAEETEMRGSRLASWLGPGEKEFADNVLVEVQAGPIHERPTAFRTSTGEILVLSINASSQRDGGGEASGVVLVVRDDRNLKAMQAQLQMSDRLAAMGTVAAGVAHEINNPLAFVISNIEYAVEELEELTGPLAPEQKQELLKALSAADKGATRVADIVRDLKTFTRSESDSSGMVELGPLIRSAAEMLRNEVRHHARFELQIDEEVRVAGNEAKLGQVFMNLILNAAQAIPMGNANDNLISVHCKRAGDVAHIEVRDTGAGIPAERLDRIFDAFYTTKAVGVGTGLGLSICHQIIMDLGGRIEVESVLGEGTAFTISLPVAKSKASSTSGTSSKPVPLVPRSRILVIDDEVEVATSVQRILGKHHEVDVTTSAREGQARLQESDFDLILCDLMMPEITGKQFFQELESSCPALIPRVVFLTGGVFGAEEESFVRSVSNRCIPKPFTAETLRRVAAEVLSGSSQGG